MLMPTGCVAELQLWGFAVHRESDWEACKREVEDWVLMYLVRSSTLQPVFGHTALRRTNGSRMRWRGSRDVRGGPALADSLVPPYAASEGGGVPSRMASW